MKRGETHVARSLWSRICVGWWFSVRGATNNMNQMCFTFAVFLSGSRVPGCICEDRNISINFFGLKSQFSSFSGNVCYDI